MFFVFGPSGQMLSGGPENLAAITAVRRVSRPAALRGRAINHPTQDDPVLVPEQSARRQRPANLRGQDALNSYAHTVQGPKETRRPITRVRDVMTHGALSLPQTTRVHEAWHWLNQQQIGQAPVVNTTGQVIGMLMRSDIGPEDLLPHNDGAINALINARRPVTEVMVSPVPTVAPDTDVRRVATALLDTGLPGLPVTDETGLLAGFISRTDILRAVAADPPLDLWS